MVFHNIFQSVKIWSSESEVSLVTKPSPALICTELPLTRFSLDNRGNWGRLNSFSDFQSHCRIVLWAKTLRPRTKINNHYLSSSFVSCLIYRVNVLHSGSSQNTVNRHLRNDGPLCGHWPEAVKRPISL